MAEFHRVFFGADFTYKIDSFLSVQDCALAKIMAKNNNFRIAKFVFASQIFTLSTANDFLPPKIMIDLPCQESIDFRYFYFCQKKLRSVLRWCLVCVSRLCGVGFTSSGLNQRYCLLQIGPSPYSFSFIFGLFKQAIQFSNGLM